MNSLCVGESSQGLIYYQSLIILCHHLHQMLLSAATSNRSCKYLLDMELLRWSHKTKELIRGSKRPILCTTFPHYVKRKHNSVGTTLTPKDICCWKLVSIVFETGLWKAFRLRIHLLPVVSGTVALVSLNMKTHWGISLLPSFTVDMSKLASVT